MCARYTLRKPAAEIANIFAARWLASGGGDVPPRYNIAPSQSVLVVARDEDGHAALRWMRWGLVPHWAPDISIGQRLINARMETVQQKPAFRDAVRHRRCIIPFDGFYEWTTAENKKHPHFIHLPDHRVLAFAGLWETWNDPASTMSAIARSTDSTSPASDALESCALLTREANAQMSTLHTRMPVMLDPVHASAWLHAPTAQAALEVLEKSPPTPPLAIDAVNPQVNRPTFDDPSCIELAPPTHFQQQSLF